MNTINSFCKKIKVITRKLSLFDNGSAMTLFDNGSAMTYLSYVNYYSKSPVLPLEVAL